VKNVIIATTALIIHAVLVEQGILPWKPDHAQATGMTDVQPGARAITSEMGGATLIAKVAKIFGTQDSSMVVIVTEMITMILLTETMIHPDVQIIARAIGSEMVLATMVCAKIAKRFGAQDSSTVVIVTRMIHVHLLARAIGWEMVFATICAKIAKRFGTQEPSMVVIVMTRMMNLHSVIRVLVLLTAIKT